MAQVDCFYCGRYADDMDGACPHCGLSVFEEVNHVFDNGKLVPKKGVTVSSSGRLTEGEKRRVLAALEAPLTGARSRSGYRTGTVLCGTCGSERSRGQSCPWCAQHMPQESRSRLPRKSGPLRPVNMPTREDYGWLDSLTAEVARAGELYERTREDVEQAQWRAAEQQKWIDENFLHERALSPEQRHEYVEALGVIAAGNEAFTRYVDARERYFRLLNELSAVEKPNMTLPSRAGFEDIDDPYRDTRKDDGSLRWAMKRAERDERDRKGNRSVDARKFNCPDGL